MASADASLRFFGIRHHGPGCARSLAQALAQWQPDCLLIEGPLEADALITQGNCMSAPRVVIKARPRTDKPVATWLSNKSRTQVRSRS